MLEKFSKWESLQFLDISNFERMKKYFYFKQNSRIFNILFYIKISKNIFTNIVSQRKRIFKKKIKE